MCLTCGALLAPATGNPCEHTQSVNKHEQLCGRDGNAFMFLSSSRLLLSYRVCAVYVWVWGSVPASLPMSLHYTSIHNTHTRTPNVRLTAPLSQGNYIYLRSLYVSADGRTDEGLREGLSLHLDAHRLRYVRDLLLSAELPSLVARTRAKQSTILKVKAF